MNSSMIRCAMLRSAAMICLDHPLVVEDDLRLLQVEVDRAAAAPALVQDLEQLAHRLEQRHERRDTSLDRRRIAIGQDGVDLGVGHPRVAVDHAVVHLVADDVALAIDFHQARLHQPIDVRDSGCTARSTSSDGKHVDGALGKVHRRAALVGLLVERAAFGHVVRDVGDVDAEPVVAVRQLLDRDRVVEVARVLAVDRDGRARSRKSVRPLMSFP